MTTSRTTRRVARIGVTLLLSSAGLPLGGPVAWAQTAVGAPLTAVRPVGAPAVPTPPVSVPVPDSVVRQAEAQAKGQFSVMSRSMAGGQIQDAWDKAGQQAGMVEFGFCADCSYKIALREHMVTVIELPDGETIERADVGDGTEFEVKQRGPRRVAVKPAGYGVDTNLIIFGKSGAIYPVYLRAERFNSRNVTDQVVRIRGRVTAEKSRIETLGGDSGSDVAAAPTVPVMKVPASGPAAKAVAGLTKTDPGTPSADFVATAPFDPNALRGWGEYEVWAGGTNGDDLRPETVFRDDYFTYIRFGPKWKSVELPTAYVVVDGIDELVNTRVQGATFIIESTQPLITLKSGKSFLCIRHGGKK